MLRAIVFDFDGVIVDSEPLHYRAYLEALRPLGVTFDYETYVREYIGFDDREALRAIARRHQVPLTEERAAALKAEKGLAFDRLARDHATPLPGAVELILAASQRMLIAIASGATRADIDAILPAIGGGAIADRFHAIVTADDVERSKPDPHSYRLAVERLGVAAGESLAIEDTPAGIASALGAGLKVLGLAGTHPPHKLASAGRVVDTLRGVTVDRLVEWFG